MVAVMMVMTVKRGILLIEFYYYFFLYIKLIHYKSNIINNEYFFIQINFTITMLPPKRWVPNFWRHMHYLGKYVQ